MTGPVYAGVGLAICPKRESSVSTRTRIILQHSLITKTASLSLTMTTIRADGFVGRCGRPAPSMRHLSHMLHVDHGRSELRAPGGPVAVCR
jgi:hypothetical protein